MIADLKVRCCFLRHFLRCGTESIGIRLAAGRRVSRRFKAERLAPFVVIKALGDVLARDQLGRDLIDKTRDLVRIRPAEDHTLAGADKVQLFLGACDRNIAKTPFLFHLILLADGAKTGEDRFLKPDQEYRLEFETLCAVDRHHYDTVCVLVIIIKVGV